MLHNDSLQEQKSNKKSEKCIPNVIQLFRIPDKADFQMTGHFKTGHFVQLFLHPIQNFLNFTLLIPNKTNSCPKMKFS